MVVEIQIELSNGSGVVIRENLRRTFTDDSDAIMFASELLAKPLVPIIRSVCGCGEYTGSSGNLTIRVAREADPEFQEGTFYRW